MICKKCNTKMELKSSDDEMDFCLMLFKWLECPNCGYEEDCE